MDLLNSYLEEQIGGILQSEAPLKGYQTRSNHRNWVDTSMKEAMKERDKLKEIARISGSPTDWNKYRKNRNYCTKKLKNTKIKYYNEMYEKFEKENDMGNIYRTTRNILNWKGGGYAQCILNGRKAA